MNQLISNATYSLFFIKIKKRKKKKVKKYKKKKKRILMNLTGLFIMRLYVVRFYNALTFQSKTIAYFSWIMKEKNKTKKNLF